MIRALSGITTVWEAGGRMGQREKQNYSAVATEGSAVPTESSRIGWPFRDVWT